MTVRLAKTWEPGSLEADLYEEWVKQGYFTADPTSTKPIFSLVMPPPNVNGNLHIGHAFGHVITDIVCRYKRALGYEVLWLPGTDHAGIATQIAVEKDLAAQGINRNDLSREEFLDRCFQFVHRVQDNVLSQMRRFGDSVDWSRLRFTLDDQLSLAVRTIFKQLFDAGYIYRAERLVNWSPSLETAVSDLEVVYKDIEGELVTFKYGDGDCALTVATTRLETLLGDTAIAVHPADERYQHLIGTSVAHPLQDRMIPVLADEYVDPEFGTGAVKITPAHDPNDYEIAKRHNVPMLTILDKTGHVCGTNTFFDGMDRFTAREAVREELRKQGRIVQEIRPYIHSVAHSERSGEPIEPRLSMQWWVRVADLAHSSGQAVREGDTQIHPQAQNARWFDWVDNMHDWCISRQLWWGHRIPVWYGAEGQILVPEPGEQIPEGFVQDEDVLDTWFSSALFPFSTMGWPSDTPEFRQFYPNNVLITGYDIIFFWVARMMMFGRFIYENHSPTLTDEVVVSQGKVPFREVILHGLVRDEHGRKMSKSKGNGIDPMAWIDEYGVDATRFALARGANPGMDHNVGSTYAQLARNFVTKVYNAARFAMINGAKIATLPDQEQLTEADRWIITTLNATITSVDADFADYAFGKASDTLYHFVWDDLCDWYLEIAKIQIQQGKVESTQIVLGVVFDVVLRLLHPFIPFVTEVLWKELTGESTIITAPWPKANSFIADPSSVSKIGDMQKIVTEIRRFRNDQGIKPSAVVTAQLQGSYVLSSQMHDLIVGLTKIDDSNQNISANAQVELSLSNAVMIIEFDTSGAVDIAAEKAKLEKELAQARKDLTTAEVKLNNPEFIAHAPQKVVDTIKQRFATATTEVQRIENRLTQL